MAGRARVVDLEGQDSAKGTGEDRQVSNVVQFPRDWIGPSEELIPFGPRAQRVAVDDPHELPSASDFWGEHAAAMHSVLEDPNAERALAETVPPAEDAPPQRTRGRVTTNRRRAAPPVIALVAASVVAVLVLAQPRQVAKPPVLGSSVGFLADAGRRLTNSEGIVGAVRREQASAVAAMQRVRVIRRLVAQRHHVAVRSSPAGAGPGATTITVHYSSPSLSTTPAVTYVAPSASSGSGSGGTTTTGPSTSGTSGSASNATSGNSGTSSSTSAPAGPVGAGAPFGPGHLG